MPAAQPRPQSGRNPGMSKGYPRDSTAGSRVDDQVPKRRILRISPDGLPRDDAE